MREPLCVWLVLAALALAPGLTRAAEPAPVEPGAAEAGAGPDAELPPPPPTVDAADRASLVALAASLPRHGLLPPKVPKPDAPDAAWLTFAKKLVDLLAPATMKKDAKVALVETARPLGPAVNELVPRHRRYLELQARLEAYARQDGQPTVTIPDPRYKVRVGTTAPEVGLLRDRLLAQGYGDPNPSEKLRDFFDDRLKRALQSWQKDNGLPPTVVLDPLTLRRLNAPIVYPVAEVALALQRWRALDLRRDEGRHILVDMTRFVLVAESDGTPELTMPIVVGRATDKDATPARTAPLETIVVNPSWYVPARIVEDTLRPQASGVPEVLMDKGYDVTVDAAGRWKVKMPPGPDNPLGKLKFLLEGTNGVYLHDTPSRHLFGKAERTLSSGCVRLSQPEALARWLLPDRPYDLTNALALPTLTQTFSVKPNVPVHFVYQTIAPGDAGRLERRADIYGRDPEALATIDAAALTAALSEVLAGR